MRKKIQKINIWNDTMTYLGDLIISYNEELNTINLKIEMEWTNSRKV